MTGGATVGRVVDVVVVAGRVVDVVVVAGRVVDVVVVAGGVIDTATLRATRKALLHNRPGSQQCPTRKRKLPAEAVPEIRGSTPTTSSLEASSLPLESYNQNIGSIPTSDPYARKSRMLDPDNVK